MTNKNTHNDYNISNDIALDNMELVPGGFFMYKAGDSQGKILKTNSVLLDIFDCTCEEEFWELTGGTFRGMVYSEDYSMVIDSIRMQIESTSKKHYQINYRIRSNTGEIKHVENFGQYYDHPEKGPTFYVFASTAQNRIDSLTGLAKRRYFLDLARAGTLKLLSDSKTPVVIAFDLVGMKLFNSTYGMDEGDRLLTAFAKLLTDHFGLEKCSRFGEDHFYAYACTDGLEKNIEKLIKEMPSINNGKYLPVRIGIAEYDPEVSIEIGFDRAKAASDTLSSSVDSMYVWYNESISRSQSRKNYVLSKIDRAISEGWIEPYYQPIIRTYSENICGFEALARWIDPEKGLISPGDFIPILENGGASYKLDMHIAKRAISAQQQRIRLGLPVVPISINISRSDFDYCDPVDIIATTCDSMGVRKSLISIEITETAVMSDKGVIRDAIRRFHDAGFEVYMDDFGSGYSSLNILKDFDFDEIKIDMGFLRDFNEKSKTIISMAVKMAKNLGIHTLAEGVETKEHLDFLKSIGCERIQGYYYGKPMPISLLIDYLKNNSSVLETREIYSLYQKAGLVDVDRIGPFGLIYYHNQNFDIIYSNKDYDKESTNFTDVYLPGKYNKVNTEINTIGQKFRSLADKSIKSDRSESTTFVYDGEYYHLTFTPVAKSREGVILSAVLDSSLYKKLKVVENVDKDVRNLLSIYECVYLLDLKNDLCKVITSNIDGENESDIINSYLFLSQSISKLHIYDRETERWNSFMSKSSIQNRLHDCNRNHYSDYFLAKKDDGSYHWIEVLMLSINKTAENRFLVCIKSSPINDLTSEEKIAYINRVLDYGYLNLDNKESMEYDIYHSITDEGNLKFFWKDADRRFLGASKAFCDYYGFKSATEIIGKTDEDIGWHLNDTPFMQDEERVLKQGEIISNATTINVIDGVAHHIIASKIPVYKDNVITGLFGYFVDADEDILMDNNQRDKRNLDPITGLMNTQGMVMVLNELGNNYRTNGENYIFTYIDVSGYDDVLQDYGSTVAQELLIRIADTIKESFSERAVISRSDGARFGVFERATLLNTVNEYAKKCIASINKVTEIDKRTCRLIARYGIASGSELKDFQNPIDVAKSKMYARTASKSKYHLDNEIVPNAYTDIPIPGVIVSPLIEQGQEQPKDMIFCFVNRAYCEMTGKTREELLGKGYLETFPETDRQWINMTYEAVKGKYVHSTLYDGATHHWLQFTASPTEQPGACFVICSVIYPQEKQT